MSQLQEKRRYYQHIIRQESLQKLLSSIRFTLIDPYPPLSSQMNLDKNSAKLLGSTLADKCRIILDFWDKEESCRDDILICICPKFKDWMK